MIHWRSFGLIGVGAFVLHGVSWALPQAQGSIRGLVLDKDFDAPLPAAKVLVVETGASVETNDQGNYLLVDVPAGRYTLIFSKSGYTRAPADVVVTAGQLSEVNVALAGEFVEMEEFIVEDVLALGGGSEAALLELRLDSPALMDSISADLMSKAGASDAASGLRLVAGASVQDGKFAVIRGLPDRYVSSQMNGVRLPSADEDKRAVELDQFPSAVIESLQVAKTFTPDQQGDASGGAVDVRLRGVPAETTFQIKGQTSFNSQTTGRSDFLTYRDGGLNTFGRDDGGRDIQFDNLGDNWTGAAGVSTDDAPVEHKWSMSGGGNRILDNGWKVGGFVSLFYERESAYYDNGRNDSYWVADVGGPMVPETIQGTPQDGDFKTALFDVKRGSQSVKWGGLATVGVETESNALSLTYLYTHTAEDNAILAEDTRGKEYFFPGYDPNDPTGIGNGPDTRNGAPYIRTETLEYTERTAGTLQLSGRHTLPGEGMSLGDSIRFGAPELDWTLSSSSANSTQPDKRQFGALWLPASYNPGAPPFIPPFTTEPTYLPFKPAANFNLGNLQRIYKSIDESSTQLSLNVEWPFQQWTDTEGYLKVGYFDDRVDRKFDQDSFSNFGDAGANFGGQWDEYWSAVFPFENHAITGAETDVDYDGEQNVSALYGMVDLPLNERLSVVTGARFESTEIGIVNDPESEATWYPPGATAPVTLNPGDADVSFDQDDVLPAIGVNYSLTDTVTLRASFSRTVARQTFKELTPIIQQEFLGGPVFIGNPELEMSNLDNYDLRVDYAPQPGALMSLSWFYKSIEAPIEYVQRLAGFNFTTPVNYPKGRLSGVEAEVRQGLGDIWPDLDGLSVGVNATLISSQVSLPEDEIAGFNLPNIQAPITERDMSNAPEYLYNLFLTYELATTGTQLGLFYTLQGDSLVAGAAEASGNFVPSIYAKAYDTLNFSLTQPLGPFLALQLQAKNLTNPSIDEVYRSDYIDGDVLHTSYSKGLDYSISLSAKFSF
ncbi:MAG: TonB-dependent receptor [Planctomycetota bacterium]